MAKRVPASMRTRQSLSDVIEGRLSSPAGREELVKLASRDERQPQASATGEERNRAAHGASTESGVTH